MFDLDPTCMKGALALFSPGILGARHSLTMGFESLGLEVETRARVLKQRGLTAANLRDSAQLARLFAYASFRFRELLMRLEFLNWLQRQCQSSGGAYSPSWHNFAALAIKDFHVDLGSLMDAVAPVVLQASGADVFGEKKLPGFADVRANGGSPRAERFRKSIDTSLLNIIDSTARWWPSVKRVRDELAHREHNKIVFGEANQGIFFQLYTSESSPTIVDKRLLWPEAENVADFRLYSAAILGELLAFLEALGVALAASLDLSTTRFAPSVHVGDFTYLLDPMEQLLRSFGQPGT